MSVMRRRGKAMKCALRMFPATVLLTWCTFWCRCWAGRLLQWATDSRASRRTRSRNLDSII